MLKIQTLEKIETRFGREELYRVIRIEAIMHSSKPKVSDFEGKTSFEARVKRKFAKLLGEDSESADRAFVILMASNDVETRDSFQGLGGCTPIGLEDAVAHVAKENNVIHLFQPK